MSLDPKYADLPWIAHGQPDVYEAGELPEADQQHVEQEDTVLAKEVETIKLSPAEAHRRFANSKVNADGVDFSDSISGSGKIGYAIETVEYDLLPPDSRSCEPLVKRFQRLQTEVHQLISDCSAIKDQVNSDTNQAITPMQLFKLAESLSEQLQEIKLNDLTAVNSDDDSSFIALHDKLLKQMDEFKPDQPAMRTAETSNHFVYEIYDRENKSKKSDMERLSDIDRRIHRIEALIGPPDPNKMSALTSDTMHRGLLEACSRLAARSAILQPVHLDMIEARLNGLHTKLHAITDKREAIAAYDTQNKIAELYELLKKWNNVADSLPMIVERLRGLKELHDDACQFNQSLSSVESSQKVMEQDLQSYTKLLQDVQQSINQNLEVIKHNFTVLESRNLQTSK